MFRAENSHKVMFFCLYFYKLLVSHSGYFFRIKSVQLRENNVLDGAVFLNCVFFEQIEYRDYETWCKQLLETDEALRFLGKNDAENCTRYSFL